MHSQRSFLKKGSSLSDAKKEIKRWIVPAGKKEKLLIATTSHRGKGLLAVVKILGKLEHLTMIIRDDGCFDFHQTKEGREKSYTPLAKGRLNLVKLREAAEKWYADMLKAADNPVKLTDQSLKKFIFLIPKSPKLLQEFYARYYPIKERKQIYPDSRTQRLIAKNLPRYFLVGYADEVAGEKFTFALLSNPEDESVNFLFNDHGKCWVMDFTTLLSILPDSFEIKSRYCYRCGTEIPLASGWCPTCKKRIKKLQADKKEIV